MPRRKQSRSRRPTKPGRQPPRLTGYHREQQEEARRRALYAVARSRAADVPLSRAARWAHTTLRSITKHASSLLSRSKSGRLEVTPYDRMRRPMRVLTPWGTITVDVKDSRSASDVGTFWNAVDAALKGYPGALRAFDGKVLTVGKMRFPYLTDFHQLRRLAQAGEVSFEDLYDTAR